MPTLTPLENETPRGKQVAQSLIDELIAEARRRFEFRKRAFAAVWNHPDVPAAEIVEGLDGRAVPFFQASAADAACLATIATLLGTTPEAEGFDHTLTPPVAITPNEDGSVTLG